MRIQSLFEITETSSMYHYMTAYDNVLRGRIDIGGFAQYTQGDRTPTGSLQCVQMISLRIQYERCSQRVGCSH